MTTPAAHDVRRLAELRNLDIVDTPPEADYDDLAALAAAVCRSPVAAVNFVDDQRHFTKAVVGMPDAEGGSVPNELSFCAATVRTADGVLVVPDTRADECFRDHPLVTGGPQVGSYTGVSIMSRGQRVGVLCAFGTEPREFTAPEITALVTLARQAEGHLELRRHNAELRRLAVTDALTGLANRTLLFDRLELALADRSRTGGDVGVLVCDVDDFKTVNDRHGHQIGDRVLCDIADDLRTAVRGGDTVARIAGDEFVVVCPDVTHAELDDIVDRIMHRSRRSSPDGSPAPRISVGAIVAADDDTATSILRRGDLEMYAVKRNRSRRTAAVACH